MPSIEPQIASRTSESRSGTTPYRSREWVTSKDSDVDAVSVVLVDAFDADILTKLHLKGSTKD